MPILIRRALMQKAEEWAASQGISEVELNVFEFNQGAIHFFSCNKPAVYCN